MKNFFTGILEELFQSAVHRGFAKRALKNSEELLGLVE
jgi:hypothetical protein